MPAQEIPRQQWPTFLGDFAYRHFAWPVTLEQKRRGGGKWVTDDHHFLQELTSEQDHGHPQITIVLAAPFQQPKTHVLDNPTSLRFLSAEDAFEIQTGDGCTVTVHVRR